ncbi:TOMM precursor leader peptide-binding protein [Bacillus benzoevorans]|nr:TOMM precursor leader peptide-binding protein [Bacillus benzoevorans]
MNAVITVVGEGWLADHMCEALTAQYSIYRQMDFTTEIPKQADLILVLHDGWNPAIHQKAEEVIRPSGIPWLRGFVSFGEGIIGPLVRTDAQGCSQCADLRHLMAGLDRKENWDIQQRMARDEKFERDPWAARTGLLQLACILEEEVRRIIQGHEHGRHAEGRVCIVNLKTLKSSWHVFLPDPLCPVCGKIPDDSANRAGITLKPSPKMAGSFRTRSIEELKTFLVNDYLDHRTGVLNGKMDDLVPPFADVAVNLPLFAGDEGVAGRTHSYALSELTAILEGLERTCGISPRGKRTVVYDSYNNLSQQALNPLRTGVHAKEQYERGDFPFPPFDPDAPIKWVWGYSFYQECPLLVPERLAYYSLECGQGFVYETSNGCALGGSLEESIFYGILEVVERDSFLMAWYAELPLPRLDPYSANDPELEVMIERVRTVAGYELYFYNSTMEHGIPSVWVIAKNRKQVGLNLICAAGAHLDPVRAAKSAVHELAGMMQTLDEKFEKGRGQFLKMLDDSSLVQQMDDHGMLYGLPQAEERLQFLLDENRPMQTFAESFKWKSNHKDLTEDLQEILQKFRQLNFEVIVVEQSTPEIKRNELYCVKVLIPGMLPMTFGHHLRRITGLERVLRVPVELGYRKQPLKPEQLNPYPHPFP